MHRELVRNIVKHCRNHSEQGFGCKAFSVEQLEECIVALAADAESREGLLARGVELLEGDETELTRLRSQLAAAEAQLAAKPPARDGSRDLLRCVKTGNPCGTDTWQIGHPCQCANCQAWLKPESPAREGASSLAQKAAREQALSKTGYHYEDFEAGWDAAIRWVGGGSD